MYSLPGMIFSSLSLLFPPMDYAASVVTMAPATVPAATVSTTLLTWSFNGPSGFHGPCVCSSRDVLSSSGGAGFYNLCKLFQGLPGSSDPRLCYRGRYGVSNMLLHASNDPRLCSIGPMLGSNGPRFSV